ncbi:MAG: DUF4255 domain-containing protein [Anaerolineae bacterium]|nr:DUF4255 domain-containing protein [Anaerolineae bacterium]
MIDELDETLRALLLRDLQVDKDTLAIAFDQPKREWSARLHKPTLNLFLYDVRENTLMRQMAHTDVRREGTTKMSEQRGPLRLDLSYLITAWASDPLDEHRMLTRTLMVLCRYLSLPTDLLPASLFVEGIPVNMQIARDEGPPKPNDIWAAMDNEARPSLSLLVTAPLNPFAPFESWLIRSASFDLLKKDDPYLSLNQRVYDDRRPTSDAYPRHDKDTERLNLPKQNTSHFDIEPVKLARGVAWLESQVRVERNGKVEVLPTARATQPRAVARGRDRSAHSIEPGRPGRVCDAPPVARRVSSGYCAGGRTGSAPNFYRAFAHRPIRICGQGRPKRTVCRTA